MKYKVSIYPESFKNRDKSEMLDSTKKISKLIPRYKHEITLAELVYCIENMQVWCPATFVNNDKNRRILKVSRYSLSILMEVLIIIRL